jgi:FdhE protein
MSGAELDALAERILRMEFNSQDADYVPFVAAIEQVHWTAMAAELAQTEAAPTAVTVTCPLCGSLPVGAVVRTDGDVTGLRYLHCALCNTEWNLVRVTCASCKESDHIAYLHIRGSDESVRAEVCDRCRSYLKIMYQEKQAKVEHVADDLATLTLDVLVDERGYERMSPNLLFIPGADPRSPWPVLFVVRPTSLLP